MKFKSTVLSLLFLLAFFSCQFNQSYRLQKQGKIITKQFVEEIPFSYHKKLILMEAVIDNEPYTFIYDTGAEISLLDEQLSTKISLKKVAERNVSDSYNNKRNLPFYVLPNFKIGRVDFKNFVATTIDLTALNDYVGCEQEIAGILGNNIFRKAVWKIDYQKEKISFANTIDVFKATDNQSVIYFSKQKIGNAYLAAELDGIPQKFTMDTGFAGIIGSNQLLFDKLKNKKTDLSFTEEKGITSISVHGFNYGVINHVMIDEFHLGEINSEKMVVELKDNENASSLLGNEFWKNFIVTIDWKNGRLFLEKNGEIEPADYAKFAYEIRPIYETRTFQLSNQWLSHPATFSVNPNNIIQSINGTQLLDLTEVEFCEFKDIQLPKLRESEKMQVVIKDGEEMKTVTLHKRQLLIKK